MRLLVRRFQTDSLYQMWNRQCGLPPLFVIDAQIEANARASRALISRPCPECLLRLGKFPLRVVDQAETRVSLRYFRPKTDHREIFLGREIEVSRVLRFVGRGEMLQSLSVGILSQGRLQAGK